MGGRGGYKRIYKGGDIKQVCILVGGSQQIAEFVNQVSDSLKDKVPDYIREKARQMARQELQRRLEELDMSVSEARGYGALLAATQAHMTSLIDLLER